MARRHQHRLRPLTIFPRQAHLRLDMLPMALIVMPTSRWLQSIGINSGMAIITGFLVAASIIGVIQYYLR